MNEESIGQVQVSPVSKKPSKLPWVFVVIFLLTTITGFVLFAMSKKQTQEVQNQKATIQNKLTETESTLKVAQAKLQTAVILPNGNEMSPQCSSSNNNRTRLAPVNTTPIEGFNIYLVNCVNDLVSGKTDTGKVVAFKVKKDGKQEFAFGAGSGEPYCISSKILGNEIAVAKLSTSTGLPICKTF